MSIFKDGLIRQGASGSSAAPHQIDQSIRFNDDDTAHMTRTFGSGNQKVWTMSFWVKRANLGTGQRIISRRTGGGSTTATMGFRVTTDQFDFYDPSNGGELITDAVFRDVSAWYNFVITYEASNSIQSERLRIYVNGTRQTFTTDVAISDANGNFNAAVVHAIGKYQYNNTDYLDGYLAEIVWIDGQALDASSFGETNSNGIWIPINVSGLTFGTNGFHIDGRDSADLGDDESGNGNDFTTSGLASHDQVTDTPTDNFCTLNPLDERGSGTLSNGDLQMAFGATNDNVTGTLGMSSGKWYWEVYIVDKDDPYVGVQDSGVASTGYTVNAVALWVDGGYVYENNSDTGDRSTTYTNGDIVGVAFDVDNKKIWWSKNGQWYSADDSSTATINISEVIAGNQAQVITRSPGFFIPFVGNYNTGTVIMNFGQEGTFAGNVTAGNNTDGDGNGNFKYTVPTGFKTLKASNIY